MRTRVCGHRYSDTPVSSRQGEGECWTDNPLTHAEGKVPSTRRGKAPNTRKARELLWHNAHRNPTRPHAGWIVHVHARASSKLPSHKTRNGGTKPTTQEHTRPNVTRGSPARPHRGCQLGRNHRGGWCGCVARPPAVSKHPTGTHKATHRRHCNPPQTVLKGGCAQAWRPVSGKTQHPAHDTAH